MINYLESALTQFWGMVGLTIVRVVIVPIKYPAITLTVFILLAVALVVATIVDPRS